MLISSGRLMLGSGMADVVVGRQSPPRWPRRLLASASYPSRTWRRSGLSDHYLRLTGHDRSAPPIGWPARPGEQALLGAALIRLAGEVGLRCAACVGARPMLCARQR
jgi:hypothetical protein